jgi:hypothetical protein
MTARVPDAVSDTIPADHKPGGAGVEPAKLHLHPIAGVDPDRAVGIARRARVVGTAERASAGAQPGLGGFLGEA